ncbi:hypothetical protein [Cupriavidus sp. L7L]|uniref:hypothetical protein n=1 Tax=Cupriavidus sp. L7L TaxID=2546443 RepID=UPI0010542FF6|nr:hypothetical protein [Cupriavidus sp. L7L]TDF67226.1 hypothetical protein E1J61_02695 [Cupriavidus sp. L7L]
MDTHSEAPTATASEIREIVGALDDEVVELILELTPSTAEVLEAYTWLKSDQRLTHQAGYELQGKTARIFEILESEEPDFDGGLT